MGKSKDRESQITNEALLRGVVVNEDAAHASTTQHDVPRSNRPDKRHPCEGLKKNGKLCGARNTLQTVEGGWRCRHHREGLTVVGAGPLPIPPVTKLRTKADAERYMAWLTAVASRKMFNGAEVQALLRIVGMWAKTRRLMDEKLIDTYKALQAKCVELIKLLQAAEEAWEEGNEGRADRLTDQVTSVVAEHDAINRERREQQREANRAA